MEFNPIFSMDAYKLDHRRQYPEGTTQVYSNFTPRASRVPGVNKVVFFGLQAFIQDYCMDSFGTWFARDEDEVCEEYEALTLAVLGPNVIGSDHIRALHKLGYLPLKFAALPEGTRCPLRVPMFTVENTDPKFFWLVNYIESVLSAEVWMPSTSATTAHHLRALLDAAAERTSSVPEMVAWQGHDFSLRGMTSMASAAASAAGHLLSFTGTDSIPALQWIDHFYPGDNGLVGGSVAATEHSVMCAGGDLNERDTFKRLIELYPSGIVSVVSDTWDLWKVLTEILPSLKVPIMERDGKLVVRPDSGNPVDIICGTWAANELLSDLKVPGPDSTPEERLLYAIFGKDEPETPEEKGVIELLWDTFGGTVNDKGFKELDPHIGAIYGDSITYDRAKQITERLEKKGFASTNIVLGVGSYTYQYVTRDTFGFAMKATWAKVNGEERNLFKDPVTDDGTKKSNTGRLAVLVNEAGEYYVIDKASDIEEANSELQVIWEDGEFIRHQSFAEVRAVLASQS